MALNKKPALIPDAAAPAPGAAPDIAFPAQAATAATHAAGETKPQPPDWANDRWRVTAAGVESLTRANDMLIVYEIPAEELLKQRHGEPGISAWAMQLAGLNWLDDPEALIEAIGQAIARHHPDQTVIDISATGQRARDEWNRTHRGAPPFPRPRVPIPTDDENLSPEEFARLEPDEADEDEPPPEFDFLVDALIKDK